MTSRYLFLLLLLISSPFCIFLLHIFLSRILRKFKPHIAPLPVAAFSVLCSYPLMGYALWMCFLKFLTGSDVLGFGLYALIVYTCFSFCYFILFTMSETARRIHILRKLRETGPLSEDALAADYAAEDMLDVRLRRMVELKQLRLVKDRFILKNRLLWLAGTALSAWAKALGF